MNLQRIPRKDFAAEMGVTPRTLDRWVRAGVAGVKLTATYVGGRVFFTRADWEAWQRDVAEKKNIGAGRTLLVEEDWEAQEAEWRRAGLKW